MARALPRLVASARPLPRASLRKPRAELEHNASASPSPPPSLRERVLAVGRELSLPDSELEAWYKVTRATFVSRGGAKILGDFALGSSDPNLSINLEHLTTPSTPLRKRVSLPELLALCFPEHTWDPSRFTRRGKGALSSPLVRRSIIDRIGTSLLLPPSDLSAWYKVSRTAFRSAPKGDYILRMTRLPLPDLLAQVYPEHTWDPNLFETRTHSHWGNPVQRVRALKDIGARLGIANNGDPSLWRGVTSRAVLRVGGRALLARYGGSVRTMLRDILPKISSSEGIAPMLEVTAQVDWSDLEKQRSFISETALRLGFGGTLESPSDDWYKLTSAMVTKNGGAGLIARYDGSVAAALTTLWPEKEWQLWRFHVRKSMGGRQKNDELISEHYKDTQ